MKNIIFILNKSSGTFKQQKYDAEKLIRQEINKYKNSNWDIKIISAHGKSVSTLIETAVNEKPYCVAVAGGDGTISAAANICSRTGTNVGIIPMGTFNNFAKDAGISINPAQAVSDIFNGITVFFDAAALNGRVFINNSSIGLYPHSVRERKRMQEMSGLNKIHAMFWASMKVLARFPRYKLLLQYDNHKYYGIAPFVFVGNNKYTIRLGTLGSREKIDEGQLNLYFAFCSSRFCLLRQIYRFFLGKRSKASIFECETKKIIIKSKKKTSVSLDGEVYRFKSPLVYTIKPRALRIIKAKN